MLGDSANATGDMLHTLDGKKWSSLMKPWPRRSAVEGGFTIDDSAHDPAAADGAGTMICPAVQTRVIIKSRKAVFGMACSKCPLRSRCTTAKHGRTCVASADEGFQAVYRQRRPMVDRSIAWLARGNRRVPYRGVEKNNNWLHHRVAALNLRRLLALGLSVGDGSWQLA